MLGQSRADPSARPGQAGPATAISNPNSHVKLLHWTYEPSLVAQDTNRTVARLGLIAKKPPLERLHVENTCKLETDLLVD